MDAPAPWPVVRRFFSSALLGELMLNTDNKTYQELRRVTEYCAVDVEAMGNDIDM